MRRARGWSTNADRGGRVREAADLPSGNGWAGMVRRVGCGDRSRRANALGRVEVTRQEQGTQRKQKGGEDEGGRRTEGGGGKKGRKCT